MTAPWTAPWSKLVAMRPPALAAVIVLGLAPGLLVTACASSAAQVRRFEPTDRAAIAAVLD